MISTTDGDIATIAHETNITIDTEWLWSVSEVYKQ